MMSLKNYHYCDHPQPPPPAKMNKIYCLKSVESASTWQISKAPIHSSVVVINACSLRHQYIRNPSRFYYVNEVNHLVMPIFCFTIKKVFPFMKNEEKKWQNEKFRTQKNLSAKIRQSMLSTNPLQNEMFQYENFLPHDTHT